METEMTREQFLETVGFGVVALFGFGNVMKALGKTPSLPAQPAAAPTSRGYGGVAIKHE